MKKRMTAFLQSVRGRMEDHHIGRPLFVGGLVFVAFWATVPQQAGDAKACQSLLALLTVMGFLAHRRFPRASIALTITFTFAAWVMGLTYDPLLLASITVFSFAEGHGVGMHKRFMLCALTLLVLALLVCTSPVAEARIRWIILSCTALSGAWILGIRTRQRREESVIRAQMDERLRLAQEIHDLLSYSLGTIGVRAGVAARVDVDDPQKLCATLHEIEHVSQSGVQQLRELLDQERDAGGATRETKGAVKKKWSLEDELHSVKTLCEKSGLLVRIHIDSRVDLLPDAIRTTLLRAAKELTVNVLTHAYAHEMHMSVVVEPTNVRMVVADNGEGSVASLKPGHGITAIRERVALLDGHLVLSDAPDGGLQASLTIPCDAHGI